MSTPSRPGLIYLHLVEALVDLVGWGEEDGHVIRRVVALTVLFLGFWGGAKRAQAEPKADDQALATVLFNEGRALMSAGRIPEACAKLEESQRLDPSGGTLLNLALCHEQEGRVARSWSEFNEAGAFARRAGRADREAVAGEHARALEPRLSRLTIVVPEGARVDGLHIECDGRELGSASWSTAMPVDGGTHVVRATAFEKVPFVIAVLVAKESDSQTVEIPQLAVAPTAAAAAESAANPVALSLASPVPDAGGERAPSVRSGRVLALTIGAAGLVQLGISGFFGWRAIDKHRQSDALCPGGNCINQRGVDLSNQAGHAADAATVLALTGLASVAVGVYLLATSPKVATAEVDAKPIVRVAICGRGSTIALQGRF